MVTFLANNWGYNPLRKWDEPPSSPPKLFNQCLFYSGADVEGTAHASLFTSNDHAADVVITCPLATCKRICSQRHQSRWANSYDLIRLQHRMMIRWLVLVLPFRPPVTKSEIDILNGQRQEMLLKIMKIAELTAIWIIWLAFAESTPNDSNKFK